MDSLPNEMILHILTFLSENDCLALTLSAISDRVCLLYARKRR